MQVAVRHIAEPAEFLGAHADRVERHLLTSLQEEVVPGDPRPRLHPVDDGDSPREGAVIDDARVERYRVLNDLSRHIPVIPHDPVELSYMDEQPQCIGKGMPGVDGVRTGDIVLQVDDRQATLRRAQQRRHVLPQIARRLQDNRVKIVLPDVFGRNLAHVGGDVEGGGPASIAVRPLRLHRQKPVVLDAGERVEVAPMHMPDQHLKPSHAIRPMPGRLVTCASRNAPRQRAATNSGDSARNAWLPSIPGPA
jgi:hypothetical protein